MPLYPKEGGGGGGGRGPKHVGRGNDVEVLVGKPPLNQPLL